MYAKVSRHELDGLLRLFDFPDANVTADSRTVTTVPQQQLFAAQQRLHDRTGEGVRRLASRSSARADEEPRHGGVPHRVRPRAEPSANSNWSLRFLKLPTKPDDKLTRWQQYAQSAARQQRNDVRGLRSEE